MVRFSFSGHELMALPQGALFWPSRRALLVADLHLEKASWFAPLGQMLPPYESSATLAHLTALAASARRPARARDMLTALTGATRWTWITGNHDPGIADHCGGSIVEEAEVDGLMLRHEAHPSETPPEVSRTFY